MEEPEVPVVKEITSIGDVLPKDDPDWLTFEKVPYMAIYSYVFSPLADEIRLVRNESSGPMFKNVIPENEFEHIVKNLKAGEELVPAAKSRHRK